MALSAKSKFVSSLALAFVLAGCGDGGGGGVASTPTPTPSPTPAASYTKIADMTGDRTFQTGGVEYLLGPSGNLAAPAGRGFGTGSTLSYSASTDSYTITTVDNQTATFDPSNLVQPPPAANATQWRKFTTGSSGPVLTDQFTLVVPTLNGVPLSYLVVGTWGTRLQTEPFFRIAVGGSPTLTSDMPKSGSANYTVAVNGGANDAGINYSLKENSSGTFSANFGTGTVSTSLTLVGLQGGTVVPFGTFTATGGIANNSSYIGLFGGTANNGSPVQGQFSGAFFGPQAIETGYGFAIAAGTFGAAGSVAGVKQ